MRWVILTESSPSLEGRGGLFPGAGAAPFGVFPHGPGGGIPPFIPGAPHCGGDCFLESKIP